MIDDCSWTEAFQKAIAAGGHLARFETKAEYDSVLKEIEDKGMQQILFRVGGRRNPAGTEYYWVDEKDNAYGDVLNSAGSWTNSEWLKGEPSFHWDERQEAYLEIYYDKNVQKWVWNDIADAVYEPGKGKYGYIIEFE